jgi:hypothetical protein
MVMQQGRKPYTKMFQQEIGKHNWCATCAHSLLRRAKRPGMRGKSPLGPFFTFFHFLRGKGRFYLKIAGFAQNAKKDKCELI